MKGCGAFLAARVGIGLYLTGRPAALSRNGNEPLDFLQNARIIWLIPLSFGAFSVAAQGGYPSEMVMGATEINPETSRVELGVDVARILALDADASVFIIGNNDIAEATLVDERTIILTGRSSGRTNLIVLDSANQLIFDASVHVGTEGLRTVTVSRGLTRQTYVCGNGQGCQPGDMPDSREASGDTTEAQEPENVTEVPGEPAEAAGS